MTSQPSAAGRPKILTQSVKYVVRTSVSSYPHQLRNRVSVYQQDKVA